MQNNFLIRLFSYKANTKRSPLEDFTTEILCEILNNIAKIENGKLIEELFELDNSCPIKEIRWDTQFIIPSGRPDLVGTGQDTSNNSIFFLIENKIFAGFTGEWSDNVNDDNHQLKRYQDFFFSSRIQEMCDIINTFDFPSCILERTCSILEEHSSMPSQMAQYRTTERLSS